MAGDLQFSVDLQDHVSAPAHKAAQAVTELSNDFKTAKSQLAFFQSQLALAKNLGDVSGYHKFSEAVASSRREVFELGNALGKPPPQNLDKAGKGILSIRDPAEVARHALEGVTAGIKGMASAITAGDARGAVQGFTDSLASMATMLDLVEPGLGQVVSAIIKVGGAIAAVTAGLIQGGVELALEVTAMNAQLEATFDALGHGPDAGRKTLELLNDMSRELPQSRDQLAKWTREIEKMGVTDLGKVRQELLATASAQAILGEGGDAAFTRISRKVHDAIEGQHKLTIAGKELTKTIGDNLAGAVAQKLGMSLSQLETKLKAGTVDAQKFGDALEETLIEKGAGPLDKMWMKTGLLTDKLKKNFGELFSDVDTGPILAAMRNLVALFDQSQPSAQGMKADITTAFNEIIKVIGSAITEGEVWFLKMEVYALSMELLLRPVWNVVKGIASAMESAGKAVGLLSTPGAAPAPPKSASESASDALGDTMAGISGVFTGPIGGLLAKGGFSIGSAIGEGLVNGMRSMTGSVEEGGRELGEAGTRGAREGAQVHSPSKLTMEIGDYMAQGLALGLTQSRAPELAGRQVSTNALGGMLGSALTSPPANTNGSGVSISGLTIHVTAPQGVTDAAQLSASSLAIALERFQLGSGR